jgi:hypothetical protein
MPQQKLTKELPKDEIRQWEIAALYHLGAAIDVIALGFKRRLEAGASIQRGTYSLEPDTDSLKELAELAAEGTMGGTCTGFDVGWNDPTKLAEGEPVCTRRKPAGRRTRQGRAHK